MSLEFVGITPTNRDQIEEMCCKSCENELDRDLREIGIDHTFKRKMKYQPLNLRRHNILSHNLPLCLPLIFVSLIAEFPVIDKLNNNYSYRLRLRCRMPGHENR